MIRITSRRAGFHRCGIPHPAVATDYPDDRFTPEELEALKGEPMLTVQEIEGEPEKAPQEPRGPAAPGSVKVEIDGVAVVVTAENLADHAEQLRVRAEELAALEAEGGAYGKKLDEREAALKEREDAAAKAEKDLEKRAAALDKRESALADKEKKGGKK